MGRYTGFQLAASRSVIGCYGSAEFFQPTAVTKADELPVSTVRIVCLADTCRTDRQRDPFGRDCRSVIVAVRFGYGRPSEAVGV